MPKTATPATPSVDEFVEHVFKSIVDSNLPEDQDDDVMNRLKGLGYID